MHRNVGNADRIVRIVLAALALVWALSLGATTAGGLAVLAVGAILLVTALVGFCPLYRILGISTAAKVHR